MTDRISGSGASGAPAQRTTETVLIVDAPGASTVIRALHERPSIVMTSFAHLDRALLEKVAPDRVVVPLISATLDAIQALIRLDAMGYRGTLCALTTRLPKPKMVLSELRGVAPGIAVQLIVTDADDGSSQVIF